MVTPDYKTPMGLTRFQSMPHGKAQEANRKNSLREPGAGNPPARFDEGESGAEVQTTKPGSLLYNGMARANQ